MEIDEGLKQWQAGKDGQQCYDRIEEKIVQVALGNVWWDITLGIYAQMDTPVVISIRDVKRSR